MLKTIIIDDEPYCCEILVAMLESDCPNVNVINVSQNGQDGLAAIRKFSPDLIFLDVEMPKMNGFEMLEQLPSVNFHLIFTTSYDQYALKAFRFSAVDYLLKPIDRHELQKAVQKVAQRSLPPLPQQLEILMQRIHHNGSSVNKIALATMDGLQMVSIADIISCESDDNYTIFLMKNKGKLVVSSTLKEIEEILDDHHFVRVHRSHLVNLNEIDKYQKGEGGYLVMSDGSTVDVSRNKKEVLLKRLLPHRE